MSMTKEAMLENPKAHVCSNGTRCLWSEVHACQGALECDNDDDDNDDDRR